MDRDDLDILLRRADHAAGEPPPASGVAGRARSQLTRRRRARSIVTGAAALLVLGVGLWQLAGRTGNATPAGRAIIAAGPALPAIDVAAVRAELNRLQRDGDVREVAVLALLERSAASRVRRTPVRPDPLMQLEWQREQAALVLVRQGDRLAEDLHLPEPAALAYRRARDTFPNTHWGALADARLAQFDPARGSPAARHGEWER